MQRSLQRGLSDLAVMETKHGYPMRLASSLETCCRKKKAEKGVNVGHLTLFALIERVNLVMLEYE